MPLHRHRDDCRLCHSTDVEKVLPLRPIPIHTPNVGVSEEELEAATAPLDLYRCSDCGHLQLLDVVDPEVQYARFRHRTSTPDGLPEPFRRMASELFDTLHLEPGIQALEIGSNDGTLLAALHERGAQVLGIDPAREIADTAIRRGVPTLARFFDSACAEAVHDEHGTFDLIVANDTLANLDDLDDVSDGVRALLAPDGVLVVETADGAAVIEKRLLDTIHHEHLSYFLVAPFERWLASQGLELLRVERQPTRGGSLRCFAQLVGGPRQRDETVEAALAAEASWGLEEIETYRRFAHDLAAIQDELAGVIQAHLEAGGCCAGYGASVGTVTLLEQLDLWDDLDFLLDDEPPADAITGPRGELPVLPGDELEHLRPSLVVLFAHRHTDAILERRASYLNDGGTIVVPLPMLRVVEGLEAAS